MKEYNTHSHMPLLPRCVRVDGWDLQDIWSMEGGGLKRWKESKFMAVAVAGVGGAGQTEILS